MRLLHTEAPMASGREQHYLQLRPSSILLPPLPGVVCARRGCEVISERHCGARGTSICSRSRGHFSSQESFDCCWLQVAKSTLGYQSCAPALCQALAWGVFLCGMPVLPSRAQS